MLVMWGRLSFHPQLQPPGDWRSRIGSQSCENMLIVAVGRGHPARLQAIDELHMMVEILKDDASGCVIPEARQARTRTMRTAQGMCSMWPGTASLVAEYL